MNNVRPLTWLLRVGCLWILLVTGSVASGEPWQTWTAEEAAARGWDVAELQPAWEYADTISTAAVMLVLEDRVLATRGPIEKKYKVHSIRKSLLSAMIGIQVEAGTIRLDATLKDLGINDNAPTLTEVEQQATVRQLLQARSGVYHPALYETAGMKARRPERHSHPPGTHWYYNNWDFNTLGTIYEQASQNSIYEDFDRLLAQPLGMQDYQVEDGKYVTGDDSIHRAYPFRLSTRDLARFGLLYLREGRWQNKQIVPASWVRESLQSYSDAGSRGGYGYMWWVEQQGRHFPEVTLPPGSFSARGAGGHYLVVIPSLELVVVHRVNTDARNTKVEAAEFGKLLSFILNARAEK